MPQLFPVQAEALFRLEIGVVSRVPGVQADLFIPCKPCFGLAQGLHFPEKRLLHPVQKSVDEPHGLFSVSGHALLQRIIGIRPVAAQLRFLAAQGKHLPDDRFRVVAVRSQGLKMFPQILADFFTPHLLHHPPGSGGIQGERPAGAGFSGMAGAEFLRRLSQRCPAQAVQGVGVAYRPAPVLPGVHVQIVETLGTQGQLPVNDFQPGALSGRQVRPVVPEALHAQFHVAFSFRVRNRIAQPGMGGFQGIPQGLVFGEGRMECDFQGICLGHRLRQGNIDLFQCAERIFIRYFFRSGAADPVHCFMGAPYGFLHVRLQAVRCQGAPADGA